MRHERRKHPTLAKIQSSKIILCRKVIPCPTFPAGMVTSLDVADDSAIEDIATVTLGSITYHDLE
jgi:hypothetical protein